MKNEKWKKIKGFAKEYEISNMGRLKTPNYKNTGETVIRVNKPTGGGYVRCHLRKENGKPQSYLVHRLVAQYFLRSPKVEDHTYVNHIDGVKHNNKSSNLEWCSANGNMIHAVSTGLFPVAENHYISKLTNEEVRVIRKMVKTGRISQRKLAEVFAVTPTVISNIMNNKTWESVNE